MTIDEAIKLLAPITDPSRYGVDLDEQAAIGLGIEALKRISKGRKASNSEYWQFLPGETD